jgi:hypothetical protein
LGTEQTERLSRSYVRILSSENCETSHRSFPEVHSAVHFVIQNIRAITSNRQISAPLVKLSRESEDLRRESEDLGRE